MNRERGERRGERKEGKGGGEEREERNLGRYSQ